MDATAIFRALGGGAEQSSTALGARDALIWSCPNHVMQSSTALVLTNNIHTTLGEIWGELPGVRLVYEPLGNYHPQYLSFLSALQVTIKCTNLDLLGNLYEGQSVVLGSENLTRRLLREAQGKGVQTFSVSSAADISKIREVVGEQFRLVIDISRTEDGLFFVPDPSTFQTVNYSYKGQLSGREDVCGVGSHLHRVLENVTEMGSLISEVNIGTVHSLQDIKTLKESITALRGSLPVETQISIELGQNVFKSSTLLATRIVGKTVEEGTWRYDIDLSLYGELVNYLDTSHPFTIYQDCVQGPARSSVILGSTGEEDDVVYEGELREMDLGDWLLLGDVCLADLRELNTVLLDKDFRSVENQLCWNSGTFAVNTTSAASVTTSA